MRKMRLSVEALEVESFEVGVADGASGTVRARSGDYEANNTLVEDSCYCNNTQFSCSCEGGCAASGVNYSCGETYCEASCYTCWTCNYSCQHTCYMAQHCTGGCTGGQQTCDC